MNINKIILRWHIFTLSANFPRLLAIIILVVYKILFDPGMLCDDGSTPLLLEQLKQNLSEEIGKCDTITQNITMLNSVMEEIKESTGELTKTQRDYNNRKLNKLQEMFIKSLKRTMDIEASIKKIDPNFTAGCEDVNIQVLRALEENRIIR